jgi:ribosomal protein L29
MSMNKQLKGELRNLAPQQLAAKIEEMRRELFALRLNAARGHVKSFPSTQKTLKRSIACGLTLLRQKLSQG